MMTTLLTLNFQQMKTRGKNGYHVEALELLEFWVQKVRLIPAPFGQKIKIEICTPPDQVPFFRFRTYYATVIGHMYLPDKNRSVVMILGFAFLHFNPSGLTFV